MNEGHTCGICYWFTGHWCDKLDEEADLNDKPHTETCYETPESVMYPREDQP